MARWRLWSAFIVAVLTLTSSRSAPLPGSAVQLQPCLRACTAECHNVHRTGASKKKHRKKDRPKRVTAFWHPYKQSWPDLAAASVACQDGLVSASEAKRYKWVALDPSVVGKKSVRNDGLCGKKLNVRGPAGSTTVLVVDQQAAGGMDLQEEAFKKVCGADNCAVTFRIV